LTLQSNNEFQNSLALDASLTFQTVTYVTIAYDYGCVIWYNKVAVVGFDPTIDLYEVPEVVHQTLFGSPPNQTAS